jgi:PAS domain S-box-containing protein
MSTKTRMAMMVWVLAAAGLLVMGMVFAYAGHAEAAPPAGASTGDTGLDQLLATLFSGGGALGVLGVVWKYWLQKALAARKATKEAIIEGAMLVKTLLPRMATELREVKATQHADLESRTEPVMRFDEAGKCEWVNRAWRRVTGCGKEEALGTGWLATVHHEDRERVRKSWTACVEEKAGYDQAFRYVDQNGSETPVRSLGTVLRGSEQEVTGWLRVSQFLSPEEWEDAKQQIAWRSATPRPDRPDANPRDTIRAPR